MSKPTNAGIQHSNEEKLINHLMKNGKKSVAKKIYENALKEIKKSGHMNPAVVVQTAIENASPNVMIKSKRIGGAVYQVPVEVKPAKRFFFATKWLLDAARGKTGKPMYKKLAEELVSAYGNQGSAVKKKEEAHKMAEANKAFAYMAKYVN
ncbi:MAG: 30S ribosomal protein S7 [Candidatus Peribacteria bacterium]|jgi:small subunit ribosomal protein S7|nr:30S ribosomal protein S7 [Candidatus Peribacteria bacterium]